ncbi:glycosyltransferase [Candidatus Binatus soli]|uniref:glycosyltransferase n=1 Tax=Candidatus Binatus soli TaxID=1953413 RepID=UPI003D14AEC1
MTTYPLESTNHPDAQLDLIYFDAGGGHRASARALISAAEQQHRSWQINPINLRDLLEPADVIRHLTGVRVEDFYNSQLKYGLTIGTGPMLRIMQMLIRQLEPTIIKLLARHWQDSQPDLVVSMIPNFNHAILEGLRQADATQARSETPMVTILTDLADCPPHFWIERQKQYLVCGTATAARQAIAMGHDRTRVFRTSGMIVRPEFYCRMELSREAERIRLGLDPELPTGIVMFGSYGSSQMATIARKLEAARLKTQLIFVCGHNDRLREHIESMKLSYPFHCVGFTPKIPYFMQLADFFIGKPGPGCISEALVMGLPVIVERNAWTMVQERFNTDWIAQNRLGIVLPSFRQIACAVSTMLDREQFLRLRTSVEALDNRAVFEVPEILEALISHHRAAKSGFGRNSTATQFPLEVHRSA